MSRPIHVLLAEDEPSLGLIIKESLETRDFLVSHCRDGEAALASFKKQEPDLLVLDVMMPKKDGFSLAKEVRQTHKDLPIIFLTSKSQTKDVLEGFASGGDDYLKKPFSMEELIARIQNLLRRQKQQDDNSQLQIGKFLFDFPKQMLAYSSEEAVQLTHREAQLLFHLIKNKNQVLDRSVILKKLWGQDDFFTARSMDVFITKLRKKLSRDENLQILNIRGVGYKLIC